MATWDPKNIVVTDIGAEILSKIQIGDGSITVTRVVSGGSQVPYSNLHSLTEVPDIKQELSIVGYSTEGSVSLLNTTLSNNDLLVGYSMYIIGVYVTHPSYEGEKLYMVAECNIDSPDYVPEPSYTPVSLQYDLYLKHGGASSIVINVNNSESLPITGGTIYGDLTVIGNIKVNGTPEDPEDVVNLGYLEDNYIPKSEKGQPDGVTPLGSDGLVPEQYLPELNKLDAVVQVSYNGG